MGRKERAAQGEMVPVEEEDPVEALVAYLLEFLPLISTEPNALAYSTIYVGIDSAKTCISPARLRSPRKGWREEGKEGAHPTSSSAR